MPATFINTDYLQARWNWDAVGRLRRPHHDGVRDEPQYPTVRATPAGDILAGHTDGYRGHGTQLSEGGALGSGEQCRCPGRGSWCDASRHRWGHGSIAPAADAAWSAYQGLHGDIDYLTFRAQPAATTAGTLHCLIALFTGVNMSPGTLSTQSSLSNILLLKS